VVYTREELRSIIAPIAIKYRLPAVYLFGSYARGEADESSDIDLLVDTTGTTLTTLMKLGSLYCELQDALAKPVDLITLSSLEQDAHLPSEAGFKETVKRERVRIYAAA